MHTFSETAAPKKYGQVCLNRKVFQYAVLVSFYENHLSLPQLITHVNEYLLHDQKYVRVLTQSYGNHLVCHTGEFLI